MNARSLLFELLTGALGVLAAVLGWPTLRQLSNAVTIFGGIVAGLIIIGGIILAILIIKSQLAEPYDGTHS
jgi:ABC-type antimicrobial peptide transport system permease subunit